MTKKLMRGLVPVMVLSAAVALFTGCGSKDSGADSKPAGDAKETTAEAGKDSGSKGTSSKDTLIIATANETPSVTTNLHNATAGDYINQMTHEGLFYASADLTPQPALAESYEIVSDTEWVFKLRQGAKFHNGQEVKAADVKASLELCKESPQVSQYGDAVESVEVIDDYTVKITTNGPHSGLLTDLSHHGNAILPADLIASGHDFNKEPIGTGPYKFVAWNKGESIELEANEDYWGEVPAIKHVIWKIIPEGSSRTMALEAGEVDMIIEVESTDLSRLQDNPDIVTVNEPGTGHNWVMINNEKAPFDNVDFRRAIDAAVDKNAVVQVALNGQGSVSDSMLPECFPGVVTDGAPTYDPEKAKEYLAASGLNPAECTFSIICSDDTKLRAGQVIQSSLKENLGIDVTLESMDLATYLDKTAVGDYQAAIGGYTSSDVLAHCMGVYHSKSIDGSNKTRLNDSEIDGFIDEIKATLDPEENVKIVTELSKALNETCPQVPLYLKNNVRAYAKGLEGFAMSPTGGMYFHELSWSE
jgi:peptide/nickel transport system substrate-binding protein